MRKKDGWLSYILALSVITTCSNGVPIGMEKKGGVAVVVGSFAESFSD